VKDKPLEPNFKWAFLIFGGLATKKRNRSDSVLGTKFEKRALRKDFKKRKKKLPLGRFFLMKED